MLVAALAAGCGATPKEAPLILRTLGDTLDSGAGVAQVLQHSDQLRTLPKSEFPSPQDWALRNRLLRRADLLVERAWSDRIDATISTQESLVASAAAENAQSTIRYRVTPQFWNDLVEVTEDVVKGVACDQIASFVLPGTSEGVEPGTGITEPATEAMLKLAARGYDKAAVEDIVEWSLWVGSVEEDAFEYASKIGGFSQEEIAIAVSKPPVLRGLLVYLRECYTPPKPLSMAHR